MIQGLELTTYAEGQSRPPSARSLPIVVAVALLHLFLLWAAALGVAPRPQPSPAGEDGPGISVSLVGLPASAQASAEAPTPASPLELLRRQLASRGLTASPEPAKPPSSPTQRTANLEHLFGPAADKAAADGGAAASKVGAAGHGSGDQTALASIPRDGTRAGGEGAGHGRCWGAPPAPLPVRMMLTVNDRGAVVGAPTITLSNGAAASEAVKLQALRALAGCAPFSPPTPGHYSLVRLDFSNPAHWATAAGGRDIR